jgi:hypothetical protein
MPSADLFPDVINAGYAQFCQNADGKELDLVKNQNFMKTSLKVSFMKTSLRLPPPIPFFGCALNPVPGPADSLLA